MVAYAHMDMDDMDMGMDMGGTSSSAALSANGVDFSNSTQAAEFLEDLLNDDELKTIGNDYAKYFWYGVIVIVGLATLFNTLQWFTLHLRLRAAARRKKYPAKPQNVLSRWLATATAISREVTYPQITSTIRVWCKVPPLGTVLLLLCYLAFVLALEFINNSVEGAQYWQALGVRAGWLSVAQFPLLVLLINKNNVIGLLTGASYERLNVLHRWSSRIMLLMAILHFGYQSYGWQQYPGLMELEWATDDCPVTGIAAFAILLWMNLSTLAPLRYWSYEFFVIQHILTFFGFVVAVIYHLPSTALGSRVYVFIPIALYLVDRIIRTLLYAWANMRASRATMVQLEGNVTKITVSNRAIKTWRAGSHVLLSIPRFGAIQSHPATIVSTPHSHKGALVFLLKSHKGFTLRIMKGANSSQTALLPNSNQETGAEKDVQVVDTQHLTLLDGPYGGCQSDMAAFDSVCLLAGSTGVTFSLSILQDLADRASCSGKRIPVRRIHFLWCVKSSAHVNWVSEELTQAYQKLQDAGIDIRISIHVTCADQFTEIGNEPKECGCACDKSQGPCCCVLVDEDEEGVDVDVDAIEPGDREKKSALVQETPATSSSDRPLINAGRRMPALACATFYSGRPDIRDIVSNLLDGAEGESGIAVCGPLGLSSEVRNTVARLSDERAIHKGTGAQGCYLHVESFT